MNNTRCFLVTQAGFVIISVICDDNCEIMQHSGGGSEGGSCYKYGTSHRIWITLFSNVVGVGVTGDTMEHWVSYWGCHQAGLVSHQIIYVQSNICLSFNQKIQMWDLKGCARVTQETLFSYLNISRVWE